MNLSPLHPALLAVALGLSAVGSARAAPTALPPVHHAGKVDYLSGGIGHDESAAIEKAAAHWPLLLEFAVQERPRAAFAADVQVSVRDAKGHEVLHAPASGPLLLARLAPGRYEVRARYAGRELTEQVRVVRGHPAKAVFLWPAGTGTTHG